MPSLSLIDATKPVPSKTSNTLSHLWQEEDIEKATGYLPDSKMIAATNAALLLGRPLLLTGEPGTGKTQFAYYVSWVMKLAPPLVFETKTTSTSRDLFYTYDLLGRFHDAQIQRGAGPAIEPADILQQHTDQLDYISYNALGIAILRANEEQDVDQWLPRNFKHGGKQRSVVLIDEVDKAPLDFPNDILNEVEHAYFKIPELRDSKTHEVTRISAGREMRPILIFTSNSEKALPHAFLRRCSYHNIAFPLGPHLKQIVEKRIGRFANAPAWVNEVIDLFLLLRNEGNLERKPATAELLDWLTVLRSQLENVDRPLRDSQASLLATLSVLLKTPADQQTGRSIIVRWAQEK